jgi:serine/threonine protein kinase
MKNTFFFLGDFGYARTIHEHSLRYTKVGTTAYLPPEVSHDQWRHARGYNKTVEYVLFLKISKFFLLILIFLFLFQYVGSWCDYICKFNRLFSIS